MREASGAACRPKAAAWERRRADVKRGSSPRFVLFRHGGAALAFLPDRGSACSFWCSSPPPHGEWGRLASLTGAAAKTAYGAVAMLAAARFSLPMTGCGQRFATVSSTEVSARGLDFIAASWASRGPTAEGGILRQVPGLAALLVGRDGSARAEGALFNVPADGAGVGGRYRRLFHRAPPDGAWLAPSVSQQTWEGVAGAPPGHLAHVRLRRLDHRGRRCAGFMVYSWLFAAAGRAGWARSWRSASSCGRSSAPASWATCSNRC